MAREEDKENGDPWTRGAVTLRLSAKRKAKLAAIATALGGGASPSDAIESAIDRAAQAEPSDSEPIIARLDELQIVVDQLLTERRQDADRHEEAIRESARNSKAVLDLIAAASAMPADGHDPEAAGEAEEAPRLAQWLASELTGRGLALRKSAIVRAQWSGTRKTTARLASLEFDASLAVVDEVQVAAGRGLPARAQVSLLEIDSDLFRAVAANACRPMFIVLRPTESRAWQCTFFASNEDGSMAAKLGAITI